MTTTNRLRGAIASVLLVAASSAYAQESPTLTDPPAEGPVCDPDVAQCPPSQQPQAQSTQEQPPPQTDVDVNVNQPPPPDTGLYETETEEMWYDRMGFGLALGGGIDDFVGDGFRDTTSLGGSWNVRATIGTRMPVAGEVSYIGSAQSIDALGLDDDAVLVGNGLQVAARVNVLPDYGVQPFLYAGAAWRHYDLTDVSINTSDVADDDDVFEVPVGIGVAGYISGFMADLRAEYRGAWGSDLIPSLEDDGGAIISEADRWGITANIGASF